jgi:hypothetical protein
MVEYSIDRITDVLSLPRYVHPLPFELDIGSGRPNQEGS